MAGYIGSKSSVTQVDGYSEAEADAEFVTKTGDTMTGDLVVENSSGATINVNTGLAAAVSKVILHEGSTASPANGATLEYDGATNLFSIGVGSDVSTKRLSIARDTGNVGIGTSSPQKKLEVRTGNGELSHFGSNSANAVGNYTGISLGYAENGNSAYRKVGIVSVGRGDGAARQDLAFLVDSNSDGGSAQLADTKMKISYEGYVTKPSQPAFHYRLATGGAITTSNGIANVTFSVSVNHTTGNGYNASTGIFTAPVTGWYAFNLTFYYSNGGNYVGAVLLQSNGQHYYSFDSTGNDVNTPLSKLLYLNAGDTLRPQIYTYQATTLHVVHSYFSGYLLG